MAQTLRVTVVGDTSGYQAALAKASSATAAFGKSMSGVGRSVQRTGRTLTTHLSLPLIGVGAASVKMAGDFETSMSRIVGLAGVGEKQVSAWSKELLRLGPEVGKSPRELAEALYFVASSGISTAKAMDVLAVSAKASEAGLGDTQTVADAVTSVMNAYGEANITAAQATDVLVATVREGKGEASEFAPIIGNVVSVASQMGVTFNDVGAALAGMTRLGTDAATAGTQLQAFFSQLLKVTPKQAKALEGVGLSAAGLRQELRERGLLATLDTLRTAFHGNTAEMAKAFPNIRALRAVLALTGKSANTTAAIFRRMGDATGSLAKAFDAARERSDFKLDRLKASAEVAGISLGMILLPSVQKVADALARVAIAYSNLSPEMKNWIAVAGGAAVATGPLLMVTGSLVRALGALGPVVAALLSPMGLLVVAIAAVAAAFAAAIIYPKQFEKALRQLGLSAQDARSVVTTLQSIFAQVKTVVADAVTAVKAIWEKLGPAITASAKATWTYIADQIRGTLNIIRGLINVFAGLLTGDWSRMWKGVQQIAGGIWTNITSQFKFFLGQLSAVAKALWAMVGPPITAAWNAVKSATVSAWNTVVGAIRGAIGKAAAAATAVGQGVVRGVKGGLAGLVGAVRGFFQKVWSFIQGAAGSAYLFAFRVGSQLVQGVIDGIKSMVGAAIGAAKGVVNAVKSGFGLWGSTSYEHGQEVGSGLIKGLAAGILASMGEAENAAQRAKNKIKATLQATELVEAARVAGKTIGYEQALAVVRGLVAGQPTLLQQAKAQWKEVRDTQLQAIKDSKTEFASAFKDLASTALAAFDAKMAAWKPPSLELLEQMKLEDQIQQMTAGLGPAVADAQRGLTAAFAAGDKAAIAKWQDDLNAALINAYQTVEQQQAALVATAQANLAQAQAAGDEEKVKEAQAAYDQALADQKTALEKHYTDARALAENNLQLRADAEQRTHDAIAAKQREGLAKQLYELGQFLLKHPEKWNQMGARVQAILRQYNIKLLNAGELWANRFADGIEKGIPAAVAAAKKYAAAVAKYMPHSPAEKGPLAFDPKKAGYDFVSALSSGIRGGGLGGAGLGGPMATATPVGGGGLTVNVYVQGALLGSTVPEVADTVYRELVRKSSRNAGNLGL